MSQVWMASVYAFGKLQRSSPGQQTSPCSVCVITGSNFLCGVDLTSNTAITLHDSNQEVVQLELRCEYINMSSGCGTGGTEDFMLWMSPLSCIALSNTSTVLSLELPSVVSSLYTSKSARSVTSTTVSLLWSDNSCGMVCCSRNANNPSWHLSELEVLLLNACCLHNRWMIDPWGIAHNPLIFLPDVSSVERYDTPRLHSMLAKFWREYITQRSYWYTTHRLRHIQDIPLNETSNMLKRRTVRTLHNIMISNCSPVCTVSLELRLALFFNFVQRAGQGVQAWKMVHKFSSTAGIASGHGPGSQTYSFILPQASCLQYPHLPDRSDIPALVAHFFFSILSLVAMLHTK